MQLLLDLLTGRSEELDLDRAALEIARIEYPNLEVDPFLGLLDSYAVELSERVAGQAGGSDYVQAANQYLFGELGFAGSSGNYYDPRNSCLNEVLTARTGIPIALAVVYLEIARRLAQPVYGIGLPGHFLVQYRGPDFSAYIDVFNGGRLLTMTECFDLARRSTGTPLDDNPRFLAPSSKRQIVTRMLHNLRGVYFLRRAFGKALQTLDLLLAADSGDAGAYKQRGMIHMQLRNLAAARDDLEKYLHISPDAIDRPEIEKHLRSLRNYQAGLN